MYFAKLNDDGSIGEYPADIYVAFPNTSFPNPMTEAARPAGYVTVHPTPYPTMTAGQAAVEGTPTLVDGQYVQVWSVVDVSNVG